MTTQADPIPTTTPSSPIHTTSAPLMTSSTPEMTSPKRIYLSPDALKNLPSGKSRLKEIRKNVRRSRGLKAACRKPENKNKPVCRRYRLNLKRHRRSVLTGLVTLIAHSSI